MSEYNTTTKVFHALGWEPPEILICDAYQAIKNDANQYGWYKITPDQFQITKPDGKVAIFFIPHQSKLLVPAILGELLVTL